MSLDLVMVLAAPDKPAGSVFLALEQRLGELDLQRGSAVAEARLDLDRGVFDETNVELRDVKSVMDIQRSLDSWQGGAIEYFHPEAGTVYVMVGRVTGEFLNVWIEIAERTYRRAFHGGLVDVFYRTFGAVASCCRASAGLADLELSRHPLSPEALEREIADDLRQQFPRETRSYLVSGRRLAEPAFESIWRDGAVASRALDDWTIIETPAYRRFWSL